jgi:hypothetical protein
MIRTPDPLLAKQTGKNAKGSVWFRLHEKLTNFSLSNCSEVIPNSWRENCKNHEPKNEVPSYTSADDSQPEVRGMGAPNACSALPRGLPQGVFKL